MNTRVAILNDDDVGLIGLEQGAPGNGCLLSYLGIEYTPIIGPNSISVSANMIT